MSKDHIHFVGLSLHFKKESKKNIYLEIYHDDIILILDVNSEIGAHLYKSNIGDSICFRHLRQQWPISNYSLTDLRTCATWVTIKYMNTIHVDFLAGSTMNLQIYSRHLNPLYVTWLDTSSAFFNIL